MPRVVNLPHDVAVLLDDLLTAIQEALPDNLVGLYLRGSLTDGSFIPHASDVDLLAVTERAVGDAEFDALADAHARVAAVPNPYGDEVEIAYLDRAAVWRFEPGHRHPTLYRHEALLRAEHRANWVLERWVVRERGVVLVGPDPTDLIGLITTEDIRAAVRSELLGWAEWARNPDDPGWVRTLGHNAYVVETMCRVLATLASGELWSKARSVVWALQTLPEPWRSTVERSSAWRTDDATDPAIVPEVMAFVSWAAAEGAEAFDGGKVPRVS